ncbi:MAG: hypothetical protein ACOH2F_15630 [Cellulomonas sp.]
MTRISTHFNLVGPLPFLNVHAARDNRLFLDPSAIRNSASPLAARADNQIKSFFNEVLRCATSALPSDQTKGLALLNHLHEPSETRLGMSSAGVNGHGFGDGLGEMLWRELRSNPACREAALRRLEDVALFVDGVADDLISDLTTRVVFDVLADFTTQMMLINPNLTRGQTTATHRVWDAGLLDWTTRDCTLPYVADDQLLLVPKDWVFWRLAMDPDAFYNRHSTRTVQDERTTYDRDNRRSAPSKRSLNAEFKQKKRLNNTQAVRYIRKGIDLVEQYRGQVDAEFQPLDDDQLDARM